MPLLRALVAGRAVGAAVRQMRVYQLRSTDFGCLRVRVGQTAASREAAAATSAMPGMRSQERSGDGRCGRDLSIVLSPGSQCRSGREREGPEGCAVAGHGAAEIPRGTAGQT